MRPSEDQLKERAKTLKLYGLLSHWEAIGESDWIEPLIHWEEEERVRRGLERRMKGARLGRFKPLADFDWAWPKQCDREQFNDLMRLDFLTEAVNIILVGPNGVGKSTLARNIAHQAVLAGHSVLFTSAGQMLNDLAAQDGDSALKRRLASYARPQLLVIDEVGYLSYSNRHADLPTCCSRSSPGGMRRSPPWSPPIAPSRNGMRSFPTPPVWSLWSIG